MSTRLGAFLKKFTIDYNKRYYYKRRNYIDNTFCCLMMILLALNLLTIPFFIASIIQRKKGKGELADKFILAQAIISSVMINAVALATTSFFVLEKCSEEGLTTELESKDIAMISLISSPIIAILFSGIITTALYQARESCTEKKKEGDLFQESRELYITYDTYFTNPVTGLIMIAAASIGTLKGRSNEKKFQKLIGPSFSSNNTQYGLPVIPNDNNLDNIDSIENIQIRQPLGQH